MKGVSALVLAMCTSVVVSDVLRGQQPSVSVERTASGAQIRNSLSVDLLLLVRGNGGLQQVLRIPANGASPAPAEVSVLAVEVISAEVTARAAFRTCTVGPSGPRPASTAQLASDVVAVNLDETVAARQTLQSAADAIWLEFRQGQDERETFRNDALRLELRRRMERSLTPQQSQLIQTRETAQAFAGDITARALAWESVESERLKILHAQFKSLEPFIDQAVLAQRVREEEIQAYRATTQARHAFSSSFVRAIDVGQAGQPLLAPTVVRFRKVCDGPSGASDVIEIETTDQSGGALLVAEARFDRGGKQTTFFRRVSGRPAWVGRIDWPAEATSVSLRTRRPGSNQWVAVSGRALAQRQSMVAEVVESKKAVARIRKKLKESNFRAAGGDRIKTLPVF